MFLSSRGLKVICLIFVTFFIFKPAVAGIKDLCEKGGIFDIVTDIQWGALFPISIGPVRIKGPSYNPSNPPYFKETDTPCACKSGAQVTVGLVVTYWNPVRAYETTKIPWCLTTIGKFVDLGGEYWKQMGSNSAQKDVGATFTNSHVFKFNLLDFLNVFLDVPCVLHEGLDIFFFTELDPSWNDPTLTMFIHPESIAFANPIASISCAADTASTIFGWPMDALFYCAGNWGIVYPLAGYNTHSNYIRGNVLNMARMIFKEHRFMVSWDTGIDECGAIPTPTWIKTHYKFHQLKPVRGPILKIGEPTQLWEFAKNPPGGTKKGSADNFSWVVWKYVKCCLGKTLK